MRVQDLIAITRIFGDGAQGCLEGEISSRSDFGLDLRTLFHMPQIEAQGKKQDTGDGALGGERGENRFWAVATPLRAAWQPPNASGAGGRYRPNGLSRFPRSVASRVVAKAVRNFESQQQQEDRIWP
jgi:hypothetical protein